MGEGAGVALGPCCQGAGRRAMGLRWRHIHSVEGWSARSPLAAWTFVYRHVKVRGGVTMLAMSSGNVALPQEV